MYAHQNATISFNPNLRATAGMAISTANRTPDVGRMPGQERHERWVANSVGDTAWMSKFGGVFLILLAAATINAARPLSTRGVRPAGPDVAANERLTALNGALLFILMAAIAITVLFIRPLLPWHYLVGILVLPPLALKLFSTGYRFARYYGNDTAFGLAGAPPLLLRFVVAPVLVFSTVAVFGTGLELWVFGLRFGGVWITMHTVSAVVFMLAVTVHLLSHLRRSTDAVADEVSAPQSGRRLVAVALVLGGVLAAASLTYMTPFPGSAAGG